MSNPEHFDPVLTAILAVLAWGALFISIRRETVRKRKEERLARAEMLRQYEESLRRSGWGD